jgi:ATP-dependent RNA helicase DDX52/ROK1
MNVEVIHGDRKKEERDEIIQKFRVGDVWMLICTDLMSRGIDFKTVNSVVNFDFPTSLVSYIHRVGRTGRAGRAGKAWTYFTDDDVPYIKTIATLIKKSGGEIPEWMLNLKGHDNKGWKELEKKPLKRKTISTEIDKNCNKRVLKLIQKDTKQIQKKVEKAQAASRNGGGAEFGKKDADLDSDLTFGSDGEGEYYDEGSDE